MKCLRTLAIVGSLVGSANAAVTPTPLFNGTYEVFGARLNRHSDYPCRQGGEV